MTLASLSSIGDGILKVRRSSAWIALDGAIAVSFVASGEASSFVVDTEISLTVSGSIAAGDLILVYCFARSTITPHTGFTSVHTTGLGSASGRTGIYSKVASGAESTITFTQSSSARMGMQYIAVRGDNGTPVVLDVDSSSELTAKPYAIPTLSNTGENHFAVTSYFNEIAAGGTTNLTVPTDYTAGSTISGSQLRQAIAYQALSTDESISGSWDSNLSSHSAYTTSLLLGG